MAYYALCEFSISGKFMYLDTDIKYVDKYFDIHQCRKKRNEKMALS